VITVKYMTRVHHPPSRPVIIYTPDTHQQPAEVFPSKDASVHLELLEMVSIHYLFIIATRQHYSNSYPVSDLAYSDWLAMIVIITRATLCIARSLRQRRVGPSVRPSVRRTPVLCLAKQKLDREMYTV